MTRSGLRATRLLFATVCLSTAACGDAIAGVCNAGSPAREAFDQRRLDADGIWALELINGSAIPASGYELPLTSDRLRGGTLTFRPTEGMFSDCDGASVEVIERGIVFARYLMADASGNPKFPSKTYTARYEYDHNTGAIAIRAAGADISGSRAGNDAVTFAKGHALFGDYSLRFER